MIKKIALACFFMGFAQAHAITWVQTPRGNYAVEPNSNGFTVYGLSGQGVTSVIRNGTGYSVIAPNGVTNIYEDGSTSKPGMAVDPFDITPTPVIPNLE